MVLPTGQVVRYQYEAGQQAKTHLARKHFSNFKIDQLNGWHEAGQAGYELGLFLELNRAIGELPPLTDLANRHFVSPSQLDSSGFEGIKRAVQATRVALSEQGFASLSTLESKSGSSEGILLELQRDFERALRIFGSLSDSDEPPVSRQELSRRNYRVLQDSSERVQSCSPVIGRWVRDRLGAKKIRVVSKANHVVGANFSIYGFVPLADPAIYLTESGLGLVTADQNYLMRLHQHSKMDRSRYFGDPSVKHEVIFGSYEGRYVFDHILLHEMGHVLQHHFKEIVQQYFSDSTWVMRLQYEHPVDPIIVASLLKESREALIKQDYQKMSQNGVSTDWVRFLDDAYQKYVEPLLGSQEYAATYFAVDAYAGCVTQP